MQRALPVITAMLLTAAASALTLGCGATSPESAIAGPPTATSTAPIPTTAPAVIERPVPALATPTSTSAAPRSLASRADQLCAEYQAVVAANGPMQIDGFDPDQPEPAQLRSIATHFAPVLAAAEALHRRLQDLDDGTEGEQLLLDGLIRTVSLENQNTLIQNDAARQADVNGFTSTLPNVEPLAKARAAAARALGAPECAYP